MAKVTSTLLGRRETADISTLPATVEQHPDYRRHLEQRETLAGQLRTAQADLSRISAERDQLQATRQDLQVRALLGEVATSDEGTDLQAHLDELEASLSAAQARVSPLSEALRRLESREPEIRAAVTMDVRARIRVGADTAVIEMARCLQEAAVWNAQLVVVAKYVVHPERSGKNGVTTQPFPQRGAPDEAPS